MRMLTLCLAPLILMNPAIAQPLPTAKELVNHIIEGHDKLHDVEQQYTSYQCQWQMTSNGKAKGKPIHNVVKHQYTIRRDDDRLMWQYQHQEHDNDNKPIKVTHRLIFNEDCMFDASRAEGKTDWDLNRFIREPELEDYYKNMVGHDYPAFKPLTMCWFTRNLREFVENSTFEFQDVARNPDGTLTTKFLVNHPTKDIDTTFGTMTVDPALAYIIMASDMTMQYSNGLESHVETQRVMSKSSNFMQCDSYECKLTFPRKIGTPPPKEGLFHQTTCYTFTHYGDDPVTDDQFTLDYYRIPEPTDMDALPPSLYQRWKFWAIIGVVCLIGSVLALYFVRRTSKGFLL